MTVTSLLPSSRVPAPRAGPAVPSMEQSLTRVCAFENTGIAPLASILDRIVHAAGDAT